MRRCWIIVVSCACALFVLAASAQGRGPGDAPSGIDRPATTEPVELEAVVVSGRIDGPGMWRVEGHGEHTLWILGLLSPMPANVEWNSSLVRGRVSRAGDVIWPPNYSVNVDANLFQQAMLGWSYLRAKRNPDGKTLDEVLEPALYARWLAAKAKYMPGNESVERKRPIIAARELLHAAVEKAGLTEHDLLTPGIKDFAESEGVRHWRPVFTVDVSSATAKAALRDVRRTSLDDAKCLEATLTAIDRDMPRMVANANAWARGDVADIRFESMARRNALCSDSMMSPEFSEKYGLPNINMSVADHWMKHATAAIDRNPVTVAFVPMEMLVGPDSLLDRLRREGYSVESP